MRLITTGPPKCGTTALRSVVMRLGFKRVPGALIYGEWKRHEDWVEATRGNLSKEVVKRNIIRRKPEDAYKALQEGYVLHGHIPAPTPLDVPTIVILREPRAAMVSWFRAKLASKRQIYELNPSEGSLRRYRAWLRKPGGLRAASYIRTIMDSWEDEPARANLLIVRYEEFFTKKTMHLIANFVGKPPIDMATIYGRGAKFSGRPTDVKEWYTDEILERFDRVWELAEDNAEGLRDFEEGDDDLEDQFQIAVRNHRGRHA